MYPGNRKQTARRTGAAFGLRASLWVLQDQAGQGMGLETAEDKVKREKAA